MLTRQRSFCVALLAVGVFAADALAQRRDTAPVAARPTSGVKRDVRAWPTGDRATSVLLLERSTPAEVRVNEAFTYELRITNITRGRIDNFSVVEAFPPTFKVNSITPEPTSNEGGRATWAMRALDGGASQVFQVTGSTDKPEQLSWCATVNFATTTCITTNIVEPALELVKEMTPEVTPCQDIQIRIRVANRGSGVARNVVVTDNLPEGLATSDGKTGFTFRAGDLAAGQAREGTVTVRASRTGTFANTCEAKEDGGLTATASATTVVRQPVLQLTKKCPDVRYVGRPIQYEITVANTGDAPAVNTTLVDQLPSGVTFVSADGGGRYSGGQVTWSLGNLAPGATQSVTVTLNAAEIGKLLNRVVAKALCAEAQASCETTIKGIPAVLLEVQDEPDPVEVGGETTYTITVTNQGSAVGTNIRIECTVPAEEDFVSAAGPINAPAEISGKTIRFAPLPALSPKARAVWKVKVRGLKENDVRFKTVMLSDQTTSPVEETESTHIYE